MSGIADTVTGTLATAQALPRTEALELRNQRTADVATVGEAVEAAATGWARMD